MFKLTLLALPPAAAALVASPALAASVDFGWVVDLAAPYLETLLVGLAAALFGWLAARLGRWIGLEIEREQAEALHAAIARGVRQAITMVRQEVRPHAQIDIESRLIAETAIYLEKLMPDALNHFGLTDEALDRLIRAYLGPDVLHWANTQPETKAAQPAGQS